MKGGNLMTHQQGQISWKIVGGDCTFLLSNKNNGSQSTWDELCGRERDDQLGECTGGSQSACMWETTYTRW